MAILQFKTKTIIPAYVCEVDDSLSLPERVRIPKIQSHHIQKHRQSDSCLWGSCNATFLDRMVDRLLVQSKLMSGYDNRYIPINHDAVTVTGAFMKTVTVDLNLLSNSLEK